jgi:hypothetical protein
MQLSGDETKHTTVGDVKIVAKSNVFFAGMASTSKRPRPLEAADELEIS